VDSNASCPRCGGAFHCGANDPGSCACGQFTLSAATTLMLREQFNRCVCMRCLAELQTAPIPDMKKPAQSCD
jgi:hypothetical protein